MEKKPCLSFPLCRKPAYTVEPKCALCHLLTLSPWCFSDYTQKLHIQRHSDFALVFSLASCKRLLFTRDIISFSLREITFCVQDLSEEMISDRTYTLWCPWTNLFPKIPFHLACSLYFPPPAIGRRLVFTLPWKVVAHIETGALWWRRLGSSHAWNLQGGHLIRFAHFW